MNIEGRSALANRIVGSVFFLNFEHSARVHTLGVLRTMSFLLIYLSGAFWILGLQSGLAGLHTALFIVNTGLFGMAILAIKLVALPCKCEHVSHQRRNLSLANGRSFRSRRRSKLIGSCFYSLLFLTLFFLASLVCVAFVHRELLPTIFSILRCFIISAGILYTMAGFSLLAYFYSNRFQRFVVNSRLLSDSNFSVLSLRGMSHHQLKELIDCAITQGELEVAEMISHHILLIASDPEACSQSSEVSNKMSGFE